MAVPTPHSRRLFLRAALRAASGSALTLTLPAIMTACAQANQARLNGASFQTLSIREAAEFEAIASRIIPGDDTPGAKEAGVIYFIDNVVGSEQDTLSLLREGLEELQSRSSNLHGTASFYNLSPTQQDGLLT
ncbi:MAG: gluconate 2-dehydrogenase subunit 3 family protein, partial [Gammaproteobacteria bacterium]|nr:gluconate 2-dehydrogenase subunit 3 family protein [Gammaproteobacteria bacterium]